MRPEHRGFDGERIWLAPQFFLRRQGGRVAVYDSELQFISGKKVRIALSVSEIEEIDINVWPNFGVALFFDAVRRRLPFRRMPSSYVNVRLASGWTHFRLHQPKARNYLVDKLLEHPNVRKGVISRVES